MWNLPDISWNLIGGALGASHVAYIDPNAGGLLFQICFPILITLIGLFVSFRRFIAKWWKRIRKGKDQKDGSE